MINPQFQQLRKTLVVCFGVFIVSACTGPNWDVERPVEFHTVSTSNLASVLRPEMDDVSYFQAISEDQEKQLGVCKDESVCQRAHFLRGLAALYENRELAALHFRKVVVSEPNSLLAKESRFWLWFLDVLNTPNNAGLTSHELIKRITREVVEKELTIHELNEKLEVALVAAELKKELAAQTELVNVQKQTIANLTKQLEMAKKDQALRQDLQQALKVSEKKVEELNHQLDALRRIDQEIREKVPPTRPSEKMTPSPTLEPPVEIKEVEPEKNQIIPPGVKSKK